MVEHCSDISRQRPRTESTRRVRSRLQTGVTAVATVALLSTAGCSSTEAPKVTGIVVGKQDEASYPYIIDQATPSGGLNTSDNY